MSRRDRRQRYVSSADELEPRVRGIQELESSVNGPLSAIADLETRICALQGQQVRHAATYVREQMELDSRLNRGVGEEQHRVMVAEVAVARRVSNLAATTWLADAFTLEDSLPATLAALERGDVSLWSARQISHQVSLLDDLALRALADELIAEEAPGLLPGKISQLAQTRVIGIDPAVADARAAAARADRYVTATAGDAGDGFLTAKLPAEQALACWQAVHDHATAVYAGGDPDERTVSTIMCDTLVERLTGLSRPGELRTQVNVVMTATTLLGLDDQPAQLPGLGPIPPGVARLIAETGDTWVRRLFTDPVDGSACLLDNRSRRYTGKLRGLIRVRDQHCRGPACQSRIADIDHLVPHARGGRTNEINGQGLSRGCHTMRDHPGVAVARAPDSNAITWMLPSGATTTTLPPPALGYGSTDRAQVANRALLKQRGAPAQPGAP